MEQIRSPAAPFSSLRISPAAAVLAALLCFFGDWPDIAALLVPAAVHELGHITVMKAQGLAVRSIRVEVCGLCIRYSGGSGDFGELLAAAAGPAAGALYAFAALRVATRFGSRWLSFSAGISSLLSAFNMLPVMPLDGWRIARQLLTALLGSPAGERTCAAVSCVCAAALFAYGAWLSIRQQGMGVLLVGSYLLFYQLRGGGET